LTALIALSGPPLAPQSRDPRDLGGSGAMSLGELAREPIEFQLDIPYVDSGNPRHRLDIYLPKQRKVEVLPVIVFLHGGSWMQGDKADGAKRVMPFVRTGYFCAVSVGYRLSGEARWPAPLHDTKAAIRWIRANADRFPFDPDRIGVWGRNAGAHLALMLGATDEVPDLEGTLGSSRRVSSHVSGVVNFFGVSDLLALAGPGDVDRTPPHAPEWMLIGGPLAERAGVAKAASPVTHVTADDAPVLTVHGDLDRVVPYNQAVRMDAALRRVGVPSYFVTVKNGGHGDFGTAADARVKAFFDRYLRGENAVVSTAAITRSR
jgi:acetyl esterase/lipase